MISVYHLPLGDHIKKNDNMADVVHLISVRGNG